MHSEWSLGNLGPNTTLGDYYQRQCLWCVTSAHQSRKLYGLVDSLFVRDCNGDTSQQLAYSANERAETDCRQNGLDRQGNLTFTVLLL